MTNFSFEVKRERGSVTQGQATVYCNGRKIIEYGDRIELKPQDAYGPMIGGWASSRPDEVFIRAAMRDCWDIIVELDNE